MTPTSTSPRPSRHSSIQQHTTHAFVAGGSSAITKPARRRLAFTIKASARGDEAPVNAAAVLDVPPAAAPRTLPAVTPPVQPPPLDATDASLTITIAALLTGFTAVSLDVFHPSSLHLLAELDLFCHAWVVENTAANNSATAKLMSNMPILCALVGWVATTVVALVRDPSWAGGLKRVVVAWSLYFLGAGSIPHGDPLLVDTLKNAFARVRPSTIHSTFSFPSGHTTSAFFVIGVLLAVLLPAAVGPRGRVPRGMGLVALWGGLGATVAAGRVLVDAHWLSDTLAGACLGSALALVVYWTTKGAEAGDRD